MFIHQWQIPVYNLMSLAKKYVCIHVLEEENKSETKLSASFLKQDPNTQRVQNHAEINITTQI